MLIQNTSAYRYDVFEANNIKIPETLDEFYGVAKNLKSFTPTNILLRQSGTA